jgi:hypothetical protein
MDAVVFAVAALTVVICAARVYGGTGRKLLCTFSAEGTWVYPLEQTARLELDGPLGTSVIELSDGAARFLFSPCAGQTCVLSGPIRERGRWIACLPNRISLVIEGAGGKAGQNDAAAW